MASGYSLKDQLFNAEKIRYLAGLFGAADAGFDSDKFETQVMARLPELELKARIQWIADCLSASLPGPLPNSAPILRAAMPAPLDPSLSDNDFGDFIFAPLGEYVVAAGLNDHPDLSLDLLAEITQRFSMEWAIRPFLNRWPDLVLTRMQDWAQHPSYHVRRLVSEGTRPRLPWGQGVSLQLDQPLGLLDQLHADPTRYVTRSIANHLNDITKKDPDLAMDQLETWADQSTQSQKELDWMTSHALRGLVKSGHPRALEMRGYDPDADITCAITVKSTPVQIGGMLEFGCQINAQRDTPVLVDYLIWFRKADGSERSKVFKLKTATAKANTPLIIAKSHRLKGDATTFRLFTGAHRLALQVNGVMRGEASFDLIQA
ncbi:MAG: 3-methyladenine DNA glycosylase AlkC [Paracoccaceae bacterium]|jgi:3-methyladenine DNA glycosylase AlkC